MNSSSKHILQIRKVFLIEDASNKSLAINDTVWRIINYRPLLARLLSASRKSCQKKLIDTFLKWVNSLYLNFKCKSFAFFLPVWRRNSLSTDAESLPMKEVRRQTPQNLQRRWCQQWRSWGRNYQLMTSHLFLLQCPMQIKMALPIWLLQVG